MNTKVTLILGQMGTISSHLHFVLYGATRISVILIDAEPN